MDRCNRNSTSTIIQHSLPSLHQKYHEFQLNGANLKKAELFDNVIGKPIFDVPLTQVCPPGLHIALAQEVGFLRLERQISLPAISNAIQPLSFANYLQSKETLKSLQTETVTLQREVNQAQQILTLLILSVADPQQNPSVQTLSSLIHRNIFKIRGNEKSITHYEKIVSKGLERDEGVFVKGLDQALSSFNVEHQAYHGGSFIGNHIHKALKPDNIHTLHFPCYYSSNNEY
uniref:Uncharacterized protein n=1 Tax=Amphimedon queenslandica TaxID=400682 RepID=A0A1X7VB93_AMPQE